MKISQLLLLLALFSTFSIVSVNAQLYIKGEGPKVTKELELSSFDGIGLAIDAHIYLQKGPQSVKIEAQKNILDNIKTEVKNGAWNIKYRKSVRHHEGVKIWISIPTLSRVALSGSGEIESTSAFEGLAGLSLAVSGSGDIRLESSSQSVKLALSGSGDVELSGGTGELAVSIVGSGDVNAKELKASNCNVSISGSGDAAVYATKVLNVSIAGSGDVVYGGNPNVRSNISCSVDVNSY